MLLTVLAWRGAQAQPQPTTEGPWRLLSPEYPKPLRRDLEKIVWPGDADFRPAEPAVLETPGLEVVLLGDAPFRDRTLGELQGEAVPRGTDELRRRERELALALLFLA